MAEHRAVEVANEFVRLADGERFPQMKLHKLVYIAHGWNLVIFKGRLVIDPIEAWDNGPVFRKIWNAIRNYGYGENGFLIDANGNPYCATLHDQDEIVIAETWRKYGEYSAEQLSDFTHRPGTPWTETYLNKGRNAQILDEDIEMHYRQLGIAGRVRD